MPAAPLTDAMLVDRAPLTYRTRTSSDGDGSDMRERVHYFDVICLAMEQLCRGDCALGETLGVNQRRMAARGNAASFPMRWDDLFEQLHFEDALAELNTSADLFNGAENHWPCAAS